MREARDTALRKCIKRYRSALPSISVESMLDGSTYSKIYCNPKNYPQKKIPQPIEIELKLVKKSRNSGGCDPFLCQDFIAKKTEKTQYIDSSLLGLSL